MDKMKKLVLGALVFILLVAGVGAGIYFNQPKVVVRNALAGFVEDLAKRPEVEPLVNMANKGSLELSGKVDSSKLKGSAEFIEDAKEENFKVSAGGKFYFGKEAFYIENLNADVFVEDEVDFNLNANIFMSQDLVYVENDEILDGTVGIVRGEMADAYSGSYFQELVPEEFNEIAEKAFELIDEMDSEKAQKDFKKIADRYGKVLLKSFEKNAEIDSENDDVKIGGEKMDCRVITVTLDEKAMIAIVEDLYEEFENDDKLVDYLYEYGAEEIYDMMMYIMVEMMGVEDPDMSFEEGWDLVIETLGEAIDEMKDELEDIEISVEIVTPKFSSTLRKISVAYDFDGEKATLLTADFGKDGIKKATEINLDVMDGMAAVTYEVENSKEEYNGKLVVESEMMLGKEAMTLFTIKVDKDKDTFRINIPEAELVLSGDWASKSGVHTITFKKVAMNDETIEGFELTFVIDEKDKMPKTLDADDVTNLFDLKEKDIEKIVEKASDMFMSSSEYEDPAYN
jgi:hypothetical protein